jgi:4-amino-4-deoxy-L-arabinose transferase-like glycosyltransferase
MRGVPAVHRDGLARSIILIAAVVASLAVVAALVQSASAILTVLASPGRLGVSGLAVLLIGLPLLAAGLAAGVAAARSGLTRTQLLLVGLAVLLAIRLSAVLLIQAPIVPDGVAYEKAAVRIMGEGFFFWYRPTGYPFLLATSYQLLGRGTLSHELLNVAFAMAGGWLLFDLAWRSAGRQAGMLALVAYASAPGLVLLTPVRLTDTAYATLVLAICWTGCRMIQGGVLWGVIAGLVIAASQYVRPTGPLLLVAVLLASLAMTATLRRWALPATAMTLAFVIAMLPTFAYNLATYGDLSPSTSSYGGWSLYMGTNQTSDGDWNRADADFIHGLPGDLWDQSGQAGWLGLQRIAADPLGFAGLAVRKFAILWGSESFAVRYGMDFRLVGGPQGVEAGVWLLAQLAWLALITAASGALLTMRHRARPDPVVVLAACIILAEALLHVFVEVKPRYRAHLEPVLVLIAASAVADWVELASIRRVMATILRAPGKPGQATQQENPV